MSGAPVRKDPQSRTASSVRRGGRSSGIAAYGVRQGAGQLPEPAASGWSFAAGSNVDGALTSTPISAGASASVPYSGFTTHGSPVGVAAGVGGIDVTGSGLFLVFLSVSAGGVGSGSVRLTVANQVLSQPVIAASAIFQGWLPFPVDAGFGAEFVDEPFVENASGASITVTGDVYVYPAIAG